MTTPLSRGRRYFMAVFGDALDRLANPRIQVQQALEEARRRHQLLTDQAAAVLGNERELQIRTARAVASVERLRSATAQALLLSDRARQAGDLATASAHEETATLFAIQLAGAEVAAAELGEAQADAAVAAAAARRAVDQSAYLLQAQLVEGARLDTDIETARMQERIAATLSSLDEMAPSGSVPNLGELRSKIDRRMSIASARTEIARRGAGARMVEVERTLAQESGRLKLAEVRLALGLPAPGDRKDDAGEPIEQL